MHIDRHLQFQQLKARRETLAAINRELDDIDCRDNPTQMDTTQ
jgi:hypothetical protein